MLAFIAYVTAVCVIGGAVAGFLWVAEKLAVQWRAQRAGQDRRGFPVGPPKPRR